MLYELAREESVMRSTIIRMDLDSIAPRDDEDPEQYIQRGISMARQLASAQGIQFNEQSAIISLAQGLSRSPRYAGASAGATKDMLQNRLNRRDLSAYMASDYRRYKEEQLQRHKNKRKPDNDLNHENQRSSRKYEHAKKFQKSSSSSSSKQSNTVYITNHVHTMRMNATLYILN
jgi:hypothetical protein